MNTVKSVVALLSGDAEVYVKDFSPFGVEDVPTELEDRTVVQINAVGESAFELELDKWEVL